MTDSGTDLARMIVSYFVRGDEVLLGLRKQTEWGLGKHLLAGIGGKVGDKPEYEHETNEEALVRECQEEINVTPTHYKSMGHVMFLFPAKPKWSQEVEVFVIDEWKGDPAETEVIRPEWHAKDKLPFDQMWDDAHYYLPQILGGEKLKATFTYGADNRTAVDMRLG